jgi:hypothetical protein
VRSPLRASLTRHEFDWIRQRLEITSKDLRGNFKERDDSFANRKRAAKRAIHPTG